MLDEWRLQTEGLRSGVLKLDTKRRTCARASWENCRARAILDGRIAVAILPSVVHARVRVWGGVISGASELSNSEGIKVRFQDFVRLLKPSL